MIVAESLPTPGIAARRGLVSPWAWGALIIARQPLDSRIGVDQLLEEQADGQSNRFRQSVHFCPQPIDILCALGCDAPELRHVRADRVADLRTLADEKIPRAMENQDRRAGFALHGDEPHQGTPDRFTDGGCVGCVRLPALT